MTRRSVRDARAAIASKTDDAAVAVRGAETLLARAASRGIYHWRKAARTASRLQKALNAANAAPAEA